MMNYGAVQLIHNLLACELTDRGVPNVTNKQTQELNETVII